MAEWHFYATSHGKGPCDGIRGKVKRIATRASIQKEYILTAKDFYEFTLTAFENITPIFCTNEEHLQNQTLLESRFSRAKTITGSRGFYCFIPKNERQILCKVYSDAQESKTVNIQL